jgi:hypothetical protein
VPVRSIAAALVLGAVCAVLGPQSANAAGRSKPVLLHDVKTGRSRLPSLVRPVPGSTDANAGYSQPDTQIEPSIAVNPSNPRNAVAVYQEGRFADGGAFTNGYATTFDAGRTWKTGELPKLTLNGRQGGTFERASDPVVAFGLHNTVYASSILIDFNTGNGHSAVAISVSKDGGRTWGDPVLIQDESIDVPATNDKEWLVVDTSSAPGHHPGRVYVIWDKVAPVLYNYCDHDCDRLSNWLPDLQAIPGIVYPGQGIGAYPLVAPNGALGIVMVSIGGGIPTSAGYSPGTDQIVFVLAPLAGSTPYPLPLAFLPPVNVAADLAADVRAQRASEGLPAAATGPRSGAMYVVWDDSRFREDGTNDVVMSRSTDGGFTWSAPQRVTSGRKNDNVNHYSGTVAVGEDGRVRVSYRTRNESGASPLTHPFVDTYYVQSDDGGATFSKPLKISTVGSNIAYDAFSRGGAFEGDYNQMATGGGYTYVVRCQGAPAYRGEPAALAPHPDDRNALQLARRGHQHQSAWVAVVHDVPRR